MFRFRVFRVAFKSSTFTLAFATVAYIPPRLAGEYSMGKIAGLLKGFRTWLKLLTERKVTSSLDVHGARALRRLATMMVLTNDLGRGTEAWACTATVGEFV